MVWFWLGAWCGIPLAKVLQNPDWGPQRADSHHLQPAGPEPAAAAGRSQSRVEAPALAGMPR